jgi:5-methylcytosine-specific restriction endonuclease McrA
MSNWMTSSVLVLNASYEAIHICDVRRALKLVLKGVALAEEESDMVIHASTFVVRVPYVIRLRRYVAIPHRTVKFSRRNVFLRDRHTCQYCGGTFPGSDLTLDHVIPRSKGGDTAWDNVITACKRCNHIKGDRTPVEANLYPIKRPKAPTITYYIHLTRFSTTYHESWRKYLFV